MAMVNDLTKTSKRAKKYERRWYRWQEEANRLSMWGEATEQVTYEKITSLTARVEELETQLQQANQDRDEAIRLRNQDKQEADHRVEVAETKVNVCCY